MNILYWALGVFFSIAAVIGAILPILPAWIFWILAGIYFSKASPRFRRWFTGCRLYRRYSAAGGDRFPILRHRARKQVITLPPRSYKQRP